MKIIAYILAVTLALISPSLAQFNNGGGGGGGSGGGASTIANGADVAEGTTTDTACAIPSSSAACTVVAIAKAIADKINSATVALGQTTKSGSVPVTIASDQYVDPCQSPNIAKSSVPINVVTGTTTSLVAVSGSTTVYVCGLAITIAPSAVTAATALFEYGTGAACTSPTVLTGTFGNGDLTSAAGVAPILYGNGGATIFKSIASNGICILTAGQAVNVQGVLTYVQQ